MATPLTAVAQLENSRRKTPRTQVAGDVVNIPTDKMRNMLLMQFLSSQLPKSGRDELDMRTVTPKKTGQWG